MIRNAFASVRHWVFDLDNTLYDPNVRLFDQIEQRMTRYVMHVAGVDAREADRLRRLYWHEHGTTLAGLMRHHRIDPHHYLEDVHAIRFDALSPDPVLAGTIAALPGRRIVYTNGSAPYARQVLRARGLDAVFDAVYGVEDARFVPKPDRRAFEIIFDADNLDPTQAAFFEDDPRNLAAPHDMGLRTVLVGPDPQPAPHVHHHTNDLTAFLQMLA